MKRQTATVDCPKSMVGRVIGKSGETIKALQTYTGALIQIDQTVEPTKVTISGNPQALSLAVSMVTDIVKGTFKGFALLWQISKHGVPRPLPEPELMAQPRPVYAPGYGLIPPSQLYGAEEQPAGAVPGVRPALGWSPNQAPPSHVLLGVQPGQVMHPMGQQGGTMVMSSMGGEEQQMGYAPAGMPPMAYAYPPEYAIGGMVQPEIMYGDAPGMMVGAGARMYGAAAGGGGRGHPSQHLVGPSHQGGRPVHEAMASGGMVGGTLVQVMDPKGQVYYLDQGS